MWVIGDKNQISEDVFDFMISYLPFPQKSIRSELAKLFLISIVWHHPRNMTDKCIFMTVFVNSISSQQIVLVKDQAAPVVQLILIYSDC